MEVLITVSNLFYLGAYVVRDIIWLRVFVVLGGLVSIPYMLSLQDSMAVPILWRSVFISLNLFWVVLLLRERRPVDLSEDEQRLYLLAFRTLTPKEMRDLMSRGHERVASEGDLLQSSGSVPDELSVIWEGQARAEREGRVLGLLDPGHFIGNIPFFTGKPAPVDVIASAPTRYMSWSREVLDRFLKKQPELRQALQIALAAQLGEHLTTLTE